MKGNTAADLSPSIENGPIRNSPEERDAAAVTVAANAKDAAEARMFMEMVGLVQDRPSGKRIRRRW